jgi:hypothetical protein
MLPCNQPQQQEHPLCSHTRAALPLLLLGDALHRQAQATFAAAAAAATTAAASKATMSAHTEQQ